MVNVLVTGGTGYIGVHTVIQLLENGYTPIIFDNLINSTTLALERVRQITGTQVQFVKGDICDPVALDGVFASYQPEAVIHLAGLKSVSESVEQPLRYYENNVLGSLQLFKSMLAHNVKTIVFSSSATVYGDPTSLPVSESMPVGRPKNPYGMSKLMIEDMLRDLYCSDKGWRVVVLRYFNPVGAHESALVGEQPSGMPNNLMPFITQVAAGKRDFLSVFGGDYNTHDGTGIRDFIHVVDLAKGHIKALQKIERDALFCTVNLGTGVGYSVLDVIRTFERVTGQRVPFNVVGRRQGDIAACYADPKYALELLGWRAELGIAAMCRDAWRWQELNPEGYN